MPTLFEASKNKPQPTKTKKSIETGALGPLACFALNPTNVRFETQEEHETVILFLRQHIVVNVPWVLTAIFLILAPTILFPVALHLIPVSLNIPAGYLLIGTLFWYVATFGFILARFLGWFFNIYIVTNERLVDIDFYNLLYKNFAQAELEKVQDISYASRGILSTFFNFGTVTIETAGESPNLEFDLVPYPQQVVETIRTLTENMEHHP